MEPAVLSVFSERALRHGLTASLAAILFVGAWLQANVHLNHDVGWITHSAGWLLAGKRFGSDILDPNPPLIWFLSVPAAAIARAGWLSEPTAIRVYVWLLCAASLGLSNRLLRPLRRNSRRLEANVIVLALAAAFALLPGAAFAQREYLSFVLGMPYCLLVAGRIAYDENYSRIAAVGAGVFAGIAFGFKPWLLAVPLGIEVAYLLHKRRLLACFRPESMALAGTLFAYLLAVVVFARDYITFAIPLIRSVYWAYDRAGYDALQAGVEGVAGALLLAACFLVVARRLSAYALVLLLSVLGYGFSYWVQKKGFVYHAYPVIAASSVLLVYACCCAVLKLRFYSVFPVALQALIACLALLAVHQALSLRVDAVERWYHIYRLDGGAQGKARQALIDRLNALTPPGGHVYAFSTHPFPAFPTMNYVHAEWGSALPCQFIVPAHVKREFLTDPAKRTDVQRAVALLRDAVLAEFIAHEPDVVLVNSAFRRLGLGYNKFDDVAFYNEDPRFAAVWSKYRQVDSAPEFPRIRIFIRSDAAD